VIVWLIGYLVTGVFLGKRLLGQGDRWSGGNLTAGLVGFAFLQAFGLAKMVFQATGLGVIGFVIGWVGLILWIMASATGLGAIVLSKFSRPADPGFFGLPGGTQPVSPGYPPSAPYSPSPPPQAYTPPPPPPPAPALPPPPTPP